ncbi:N-acetylmuramoyl-L-alanine amidase [Haliangium sp. UPWRP_2]|uniref:peptidoglycan recognition protein family protein n=1 Tax=Haliangium sp. UPWRP_2 TaxID=1931276 RepID=UPI000B53EBE8|nr:N-acetylmuramoyl-L-alanine amidase [Haliangium sp. UPWRP_2]PSM31469.1 N-acetylmuramoyl-L-alanine amidase [Haliangium sp. UPWRP_2]
MQQQVEREHGAEHRSPWDPEVERRRQPAGHSPHPAATPAAGLHGPGGALTPDMQHSLGQMFGAGQPSAPAAEAAEAASKPKVPGLYPGVEDLTGTYGGLARSKRDTTQGVVLHRTESSSAKNTLDTYKERIKKGSSIAAQYLIDESGKPMLVTPSDGLVSHAAGWNSSTIGIEVVGPGVHLDPAGKKTPIRKQFENLNLSPEFKERLLGYDDKTLAGISKANDNTIYEDVTGAQKRSVWNLTQSLATDHHLDINSLSSHGKGDTNPNSYTKATLPHFSAHEHINPKSIGEGEPMIEFLRARQQYPSLVDNAEAKLHAMEAKGAGKEELEKQAALVASERATLDALSRDNTAAERAALKAETDAGKPGEASGREARRVDFYDHFYDRIAALKPPPEKKP